MANDRIVAWLRIRDVGRFVRDAKIAAHSIKDMAKAAKDGEGPFGALGNALSSLAEVLPSARTETGIMGLTLGSLITVVITGTPIIVGLAGATVALAGSLGQAALGAGALGIALAGAALPLGAFGIVAAQAFQGFQKVNTAFNAWNVQVGMYGRNSQQAETALARLNAVAGMFGGDTMIQLVKQWGRFQGLFRTANAPALRDLIKIFSLFLDTAEQLLPLFSKMSKAASGSVLDAFRTLASVLTGPEVMGAFETLTRTFKEISGPLAQTLINFFVGLLNIAARLGPSLGWLVNEFLNLSEAFLNWGRSGSLSILVEQFQAWWGLLKAVGGLLVTILGGGASEGKSLVVELTNIVNKWNDWLNTLQGQNAMASFFRDAGDMTRGFVKIIAGIVVFFFKFGRALLPFYTKVFGGIAKGVHQFMEALKPFKPFWDNVLGPLLLGIAKGVLGGVVGAFEFLILVMKVLGPVFGAIGKAAKPFRDVFEKIGMVIGFIFGPAILKALGSLGKLSFLLKPMAGIFRVLELPMRMAGSVLGFIITKAEGLFTIFGKLAFKALPILRSGFDAIVRFFYGAGSRFYNAGAWLWTNFRKGILKLVSSGIGLGADLGKAAYNFIASNFNKALPNRIGPHGIINLPNNPIPMLAAGGIVSGSGSWITGEAGPEINTLRNGRVSVVPLSPAVSAQATSATLAPSEKKVIVTKVYLRGKQIAEAVADEAEDEAARK